MTDVINVVLLVQLACETQSDSQVSEEYDDTGVYGDRSSKGIITQDCEVKEKEEVSIPDDEARSRARTELSAIGPRAKTILVWMEASEASEKLPAPDSCLANGLPVTDRSSLRQ